MINYLKKDITTVERGIIGHGCNASGGFGSGVAGAIRKKWPEVYKEYKKLYNADLLSLGVIFCCRVDVELIVANMITQEKYGYDGAAYADPNAIADTVEQAVQVAKSVNLPVYFPKIGCGLGGLDWEYEVRSIYEYVANKYPEVEINICSLEE